MLSDLNKIVLWCDIWILFITLLQLSMFWLLLKQRSIQWPLDIKFPITQSQMRTFSPRFNWHLMLRARLATSGSPPLPLILSYYFLVSRFRHLRRSKVVIGNIISQFWALFCFSVNFDRLIADVNNCNKLGIFSKKSVSSDDGNIIIQQILIKPQIEN